MLVTPWGFRDILPDEAVERERIALAVKSVLGDHAYLPVETPLIEDKVALEEGGRVADTPFKLFDDDGRLLVVRPDNTLSIARLVSSRMRACDLPLRLRYEAPVVREQTRFAGGSRQFTQLGYELIGLGGAGADAEVVNLAAEAMDALEISEWSIVCGSVRPMAALLERAGDRELADDAFALIHANNLVDLDQRIAEASLDAGIARAICALPRLHGGREVLDRADELLAGAGIADCATQELRDLMDALEVANSAAARRVSFDFSILNSFDYYTGIVFKAYAKGLPDPVGSGGRYDALVDGMRGPAGGLGTPEAPVAGARRGTSASSGLKNVPAAGFAFSLERLEGALQALEDERVGAIEGTVVRRASAPLRIAVPKGSLNAGTIAVLEAAGLDVAGLRDPGRHLIIPSRDTVPADQGGIGDVEFVIVRATDAPAFVACGGADCGFCGRDSLIEADLNLLELVDLGYGACRFIEAEPASRAGAAERAYARRGSLRVATKYPRIAARWYASRGIAVDIVALHGNIELGPIVGMTDRIVDITATGTTLRENNLVITGEIMTCTARYFANPGLARTDRRVRELCHRLKLNVSD